ncbi:hypothetical protein H7I87_00465 [Mycobacterium timonense]|uniref:Uncharacterized protein n=1 Tax=Mycobacterium bouchedurhonense TaxID=701041 RepID=A0AAW5S016_MYCBC|nr:MULTISPECIES: hypothetical protein [Mycobacterium avium complex (MAC)]MCV6988691.1 hypothetical protein [Mycobacterium bouchedurhonense]MCV6993239.1 hypothetical protein [Mycobacterium timonense]MDV3306600.1 hypothetical protein [Mycobacterium avium subsp. hominissuis]
MAGQARIYPNTGHYDLDLANSGDGWSGTFAALVRAAADDILDDGPFGPVEVTTGSHTFTGVLLRSEPSRLVLGPLDGGGHHWLIPTDSILRLRA